MAPQLLMPDLADSDLDVANSALHLIGAEALTAFSDDSPEGKIATSIFEDTINSALSGHRWRFASKQRALTKSSVDPASRWDSAYSLPNDCVIVSAATINDARIKYDIYQRKIYCDATSTDTLVIDYIFRPDVVDWPAPFKMAVTYSLASIFALSLARDARLSDVMGQQSLVHFARARHIDSQQQTTRKLTTTGYISQRRT